MWRERHCCEVRYIGWQFIGNNFDIHDVILYLIMILSIILIGSLCLILCLMLRESGLVALLRLMSTFAFRGELALHRVVHFIVSNLTTEMLTRQRLFPHIYGIVISFVLGCFVFTALCVI